MKIYGIQNNYNSFTSVKHLPTKQQINELQVFIHHIYEYKKGLRNLILTTEKTENKDIIIERLERENKGERRLSYFIQPVSENKINVFFGNPESVEVIKSFKQTQLNKYTPEQDFILGTLLGYDKIQQCERYLKKIAHTTYEI